MLFHATPLRYLRKKPVHKAMKNPLFQFPLYLLALLVWTGCAKKDNPMTPPNTNNYQQYGTPLGQVPTTENMVMYEVNLRALEPQPNLQGVIQHLDHIQSLGVNVIWLMPIHPIGTVKSVNSPYSIRDFKAVNPEFGTLADLRQLTTEAHARGMAVILDWVANHTAWDHPWITAHPEWYTRDGAGNIVHPPGTNWLDVADLNYDHADMRQAMADAMRYWVLEANVDGFRCDHADGVPFDFWATTWQQLKALPNRELILFAEGSRTDHFDAGFDLAFGWNYYGSMQNVFSGQSVQTLHNTHAADYADLAPEKHWVRFTTNHDESAWNQTPISLFNGKSGALAASAATIFSGGVPLIYGSQEVGHAAPIPFFSNTTINWNQEPALLAAYQNLLNFYRSSPAARRGASITHLNPDVWCIEKTLGNETVLVVVNLRNQAVSYTLPQSLVQTAWNDVRTGNALVLNTGLQLGAYQVYVLQRNQ
jgi:glycosidase